MTQFHQQTRTHSRDRGSRFGRQIGYALAPVDGRQVNNVGPSGSRCLTHASCNPPGGIAILPGGHRHSIARWLLPSLSDRRLVCPSRRAGRHYSFNARSGLHSALAHSVSPVVAGGIVPIGIKASRNQPFSEAGHSVEHLSYVARSMSHHRTKGLVIDQEVVGEIRNV